MSLQIRGRKHLCAPWGGGPGGGERQVSSACAQARGRGLLQALEGRGPSLLPCGTSTPPALPRTWSEFLDPGRFRQHLIFLFAKDPLHAPVG